jgi:D-alanine--poly(phosphoribitol) ligase subunit 1
MRHHLENILDNIQKYGDEPAFCIADVYYTYKQFGEAIATIQEQLAASALPPQSNVGILAYDDLPTYASVFAILFSGHTFVPINPLHPRERNESIIEQVQLSVLLSSTPENAASKLAPGKIKVVRSTPSRRGAEIRPHLLAKSRNAYILFTSGSTGIPKGVPVTIENLESFRDRFIQMFDMTFDLSIMSYVVPLCIGACVYTLPFESVKYMQVYRVLEDYDITFALLVPSIITHLRPYFDEIRLERMRYCLFCGEALYEAIALAWAECVPAAEILNVYGPTEATIFCMTYPVNRDGSNKSFNGVLCIGGSMQNTSVRIVDETMHPVEAGERGELCLSGLQVTPGYWKNSKKNEEAFITLENTKYYRTGDMCFADGDGDVFYTGRLDFQVKIQGFRVELGEIEQRAREFLKTHAVVATARQNESTTWQIILFIENYSGPVNPVQVHLKNTLPGYMLPARIVPMQQFPLNSNGKIDRKALLQALN